MRADRGSMPGQRVVERADAREAHRSRERFAFGRIVGQDLGLPVVAVLQPVLDIAQEEVRVAQGRDAGVRQQPALGDRRQRRQRPAGAQVRLAPAAHELHRLDDELDFANAARSELDVRRVVVALALLADLAMDVAQTLVRIEVQVLAKDERRDQRIELVVPGARHGPRLEPRVALPGASLRDQVLFERRVRHRQRTARTIRAQPHVDAEHVAVGAHVVQRADDAAAEPLEEIAIRQRPRAVGLAVFRVDEDQVHVGRHVELAAAELAHADHDEILRPPALVARLAVGVGQDAVVQRDGGTQRDFRQPRHVAADLGEIGAPREVARERVQEHAATQLAQSGGKRAPDRRPRPRSAIGASAGAQANGAASVASSTARSSGRGPSASIA